MVYSLGKDFYFKNLENSKVSLSPLSYVFDKKIEFNGDFNVLITINSVELKRIRLFCFENGGFFDIEENNSGGIRFIINLISEQESIETIVVQNSWTIKGETVFSIMRSNGNWSLEKVDKNGKQKRDIGEIFSSKLVFTGFSDKNTDAIGELIGISWSEKEILTNETIVLNESPVFASDENVIIDDISSIIKRKPEIQVIGASIDGTFYVEEHKSDGTILIKKKD